MSKTDLTKNAPTRAMKQATVGATALKSIKVKIMPAKGQPMLTWVGKRPLSHVTVFPAPCGEITVAVKVIDMLSEEVFLTNTV